jgi:hypothetical protein
MIVSRPLAASPRFPIKRLGILLAGTGMLLVVYVLFQGSAQAHAPTSTPTLPPIPTPSCAQDRTLDVVPARTWAVISDTITVTVSVSIAPTINSCYYATYDLTLSQRGEDAPLFEHTSPPVIGPGVSYPAVFTLSAIHTGTITLRATAYGEYYVCISEHCYWQWAYVSGESDPVMVWAEAYETYMPLVPRDGMPGP